MITLPLDASPMTTEASRVWTKMDSASSASVEPSQYTALWPDVLREAHVKGTCAITQTPGWTGIIPTRPPS